MAQSLFHPNPSDHSEFWGEGCAAPCLQNEHDGPNLSHTLTGNGALLSVSKSSNSITFISGPLYFYRVIPRFTPPPGYDLARSSLSGISWCHGRGWELKCVAIVPWQCCFISFVVLVSLYLREGKGINFLLHGVNIVDSVVWSFLYI